MDRRFKIDFFELAFLVEACIPPVPIARGMFWDDVINDYYHQMTPDERVRLWEWLNKNHNYKHQLEKGNEEVVVFEARFNPDNQYYVFTEFKGREESFECFLVNNKYYTLYYPGSRSKWISPDHIKLIKKIEYVPNT
jgi:hypothetical protein